MFHCIFVFFLELLTSSQICFLAQKDIIYITLFLIYILEVVSVCEWVNNKHILKLLLEPRRG